MDTIMVVERITSNIMSQYTMLLACVSGAYSRAIGTQDPTTPKVRAEFGSSLQLYSTSYLDCIEEQLKQSSSNLMELTLGASGIVLGDSDKQTLVDHLAGSLDDLCASLRMCVARDNQAGLAELRKFSLRIHLIQLSTGVGKTGAIVRERINAAMPTFTQQDSIGRKRGSETFVRAMIRQYLLLVSIETLLFAFAKSGNDLAQWVREDGALGQPFSITGGSHGYKTYEQIRGDVFHPNSTASVIVFKE